MRDVTEKENGFDISDITQSALMQVVRAMRKLTLEEKAKLLEHLSRDLQYGIRQQERKDKSWDANPDTTHGSLPKFGFRRDAFGRREVYEITE